MRLIKSFILLVLLLFTSVAQADTILVGSDGSNYDSTTCWLVPASTLGDCTWKASRYEARNTGTISYFQLRSPITPTGCTNDSGCWAIYEGGTSSSLGALKAWTCFSGYNWTTIGAGTHTFLVENTETDLTVTAGQHYWIVMHSYAVDSTHYATAGCSAYIPAYRGKDNETCMEVVQLDRSVAPCRNEVQCSYASPPAPETFDFGAATYVMWGVWASEETPSVPTAISGVTILGGSIR